MRKRILSFVLAIVLCISIVPAAVAAHNDHQNFKAKHSYKGHFTDVHEDDWFCSYVGSAYEFGLVNGMTETQFGPNGELDIAQAVTLAARIHCIYTTGEEINAVVPPGGKWYDPYVNYALTNDIIAGGYSDYGATAKRSDVAVIFAKALPQEAYAQSRIVSDGTIPDVSATASYADAVYTLYRAGILSGNDDKGTFAPESSIRRSEIAAICVRIADPAQRSTVDIGTPVPEGEKLTSEQIAEQCSPAVFFIMCYGYNGMERKTGSGFFISSDGLAITNFHVAANAGKMTATMPNGKVYDSIKVIAADEKNDLALLKIEASGVKYLEMGDSSAIKQGQKIYTIGSPLGLDNTLSDGIISNTNRVDENGRPYIQITAPITNGNSGGALINEYGKVIGVNTAAIDSGNLNFAVPINLAKKLDTKSTSSLLCYASTFYPGYTMAFDFGVFSGVDLIDYTLTKTSGIFEYDAFDFADGNAFGYTMVYYSKALLAAGFEQVSDNDEIYESVYISENELVAVVVDLTGTRTITVIIMKNPDYYKHFPTLVDFGWYTGLPLTEGPTVVENSVMYVYNWSKYTTADNAWYLMAVYAMFLQEYGFELITYTDDVILLENDTLSVALVIDNHNIYLDIQTLK